MTGNEKNRLKEPIVAFSFDTDWCPGSAVEFVTDLLDEYNLPGTFFCDHPYDGIHPPHEAALHPVLISLTSHDEILGPVKKIHEQIPDAVGSRCHQLACNGNIYNYLPQLGVRYESSWPMALMKNIQPIKMISGLIQIPIYFSEGMYFMYGLTPSLPDDLMTPGLKVLSFHPFSLYHNLAPGNFQNYQRIPPEDRYRPELIYPGKEGIFHYFKRCIEIVNRFHIRCLSLMDIASLYNAGE